MTPRKAQPNRNTNKRQRFTRSSDRRQQKSTSNQHQKPDNNQNKASGGRQGESSNYRSRSSQARSKHKKSFSNRASHGRPHTRRESTDSRKASSSHSSTQADPNKFRIIPIGGNEEVGRNMTVFEWGNDIIILDMGIQFPEEDTPGVDYIIPNIESLKGKEKNIRAVILSHGHLDHIGAVPHLISKLGNPTIIGSDMTLALAKKRNDEYKENPKLNTITVKRAGQNIKLGKFQVEFFEVAHSVRESFGVIIKTPFINIVHMGDWRYDLDPVAGKPTDFNHLAKWNTKQVPSLIAFESLGALHEGHQGSEKDVYKAVEKIIQQAPGRIIFGTFSSMLERIGQVIELSEKAGRKVAIDGFSMKTAVEIGKKFGYIKAKASTMIDVKQLNKYSPKKVTLICTGSQGEERAVLMRIANHEHRHVHIEPNDTVIFSSSVIPGNERTIQSLKDSLYRQEANVVHKEIMDEIHAGGHAKQEDIKLLLDQVKPKYVMPVYANHYILREAEKIVLGKGWDKEDVFVLDNGQALEFNKGDRPKVDKNKIPTDYVFVDGLGVGDVSNIVLRDRQMLSDDGMVVVIATIRRRDGKLVQNPDIISRGFIHLKENRELVESLRRKAKGVVMKNYDPRTPAQDMHLKNKLRNDIGQFIFTKTQRRPMVLPVIIVV
jgi:ribonuclease J